MNPEIKTDIKEREPFFSVAIPVYNGERCIERSVGSVLSQTFSDVEVVVINDGSTDKTAEILESLAKRDSRVRPVNVENGGVFRARALGAKYSRGTYLTYCDDDDFYSDIRTFEKLYERLKNEDTDVLQYGYQKKFKHLSFPENTVKSEISVSAEEFYEREYPHLLSSRNIDSRLLLNTVTKVYHKRLYRNVPDPDSLERLFMGDDMLLNLYMLKDCTSALYLPDNFYTSYRLEGSSGGYRREEMHNLDIIKKYQLRFLEEWNGSAKKEVERLHHYETADWLFAHIVRSIHELGEKETHTLVSEVLSLPAFKRAREYFIKNPEENLPVRLIVGTDSGEYVRYAKAYRPPLKKRVKEWIKKNIVYKI